MNQTKQLPGLNNLALEKLRVNNPKVYISGPITGMEELNVPMFDYAENLLNNIGFDAINPHKIHDLEGLKHCKTKEDEWAFYMKTDLKALMDCGLTLMLPGWQKSIGAIWEYFNCKVLKIPVFEPINKPVFEQKTLKIPEFELVNLDTVEHVELFYNIIQKIKNNDNLIKIELF